MTDEDAPGAEGSVDHSDSVASGAGSVRAEAGDAAGLEPVESRDLDAQDADATDGTPTDPTDPVEQLAEHYREKLPPPRSLTPDEVAIELARLLVGTLSLLGSGFAQAVARFGVPESELPPGPAKTAGEGDSGVASADAAGRSALVADGGAGDAPGPSVSVDDPIVRTILTGMVVDAAAGVVGRSRSARARLLGFLQVVPATMSPFGRLAMALPPVRRRVEAAQETLGRWYQIGLRERGASRVYASHALLAITDVGTDYIVEELDVNRIVERLDLDSLLSNIELTNVIIDSTGGLTETAVTGIRSQAVGADSLVERLANRILPRRSTRISSEPPPLLLQGDSPHDDSGEDGPGQVAPQPAPPNEERRGDGDGSEGT